MGHLTRLLLFLILVASVEDAARAQGSAPPAPKAPTDIQPGSITYEEIPYPYPVAYLPLTMYGQDVRMAYMDVPPAGTPNGRTVVLFHGMNFGGFYFGGPIELLRNAGFRVIVPDQIGFGRSSIRSSRSLPSFSRVGRSWSLRRRARPRLRSLRRSRVCRRR